MNATVQLQGPFYVDKLGPPPAHRNVIMIAAGTGINPSTYVEAGSASRLCSCPLLVHFLESQSGAGRSASLELFRESPPSVTGTELILILIMMCSIFIYRPLKCLSPPALTPLSKSYPDAATVVLLSGLHAYSLPWATLVVQLIRDYQSFDRCAYIMMHFSYIGKSQRTVECPKCPRTLPSLE